MSIEVWGRFKLDNEITPDEKIRFAFEIVKIATDNLIGVILGWNVPSDLRQDSENDPNALPFKIIDDPSTNVAELTFIGDGVRVLVEHQRVERGERLDSRIQRVQEFLRQLFEFKMLNTVILYVDEGFGEEIVIETTVNDFKNKIISIYKQEKNCTPHVKFIIKK